MHIHRKSKIVAKIADNKSEIPYLQALKEAGADVWWLNTAHQDEPATLDVIKRLRAVSTRMPILLDTKGPEIRTKNVDVPFEVKTGDTIIFTGDLSYKGQNVVQVSYPNFHNEVPVGSQVLYDDASIETKVVEKVKNGIKCVVKGKGLIKNKKSLNIPDVHIALPALTEKDKSFVHFCAKNDIDFIIHSFVRNKEDIFEIKDILKAYPDYKGRILSKIENREGFDNLAEILDNSDGIMVARGDLGAEVPMEELPFLQKKMVTMALEKGKYCIVATQALDSMIKNPRPTRAEVTDVANAILDGSGAVSMSGETAYGDYPVEATDMMARIMKYTELKRDELVHFEAEPVKGKIFKTAKDLLKKAAKAKADGIIVVSPKAEVTKALAALRPAVPVLPIGLSEGDARNVTMAYAVRPIHSNELASLPFEANDTILIVNESPKGKLKIEKTSFKKLTSYTTQFSQLTLGKR